MTRWSRMWQYEAAVQPSSSSESKDGVLVHIPKELRVSLLVREIISSDNSNIDDCNIQGGDCCRPTAPVTSHCVLMQSDRMAIHIKGTCERRAAIRMRPDRLV